MEEGLFTVEIDSLSICYKSKPALVPIRVEISIVNGYDIVRWSGENGYSSSSSSSAYTPELQEKPEASPGESDAPASGEREEKAAEGEGEGEAADTTETYLVGFNSMRFKSNFLELNSTTLNTVANATLLIKVVEMKDNGGAAAAAAVPAAKAPAAKGKGKEVEAPAETKEPTALIEMRLPLSNLLGMSTIDVQEYLADLLSEFSMVSTTLGSELIVAERSSFSWRVSLNHDLAAYTFGSRIVSWSSAKMHLPPAAWAIKSPDVSDPKAKVPPTAAEFRARYLENIPKLLAGQHKIVSFSLSVGLNRSDGFAGSAVGLKVVAEDDGEGDDESKADAAETQGGLKPEDFFPGVFLEGGAIAFDAEKAAEVGIDEDIRSRGDLWSLSWSGSPCIFLHRSLVRQLIATIETNPMAAVVPVSVRRVPTAEALAVEGAESSATCLLDISQILVPGSTNISLPASLKCSEGEGEAGEGADAALVVVCSLSSALVPRPPKNTFDSSGVKPSPTTKKSFAEQARSQTSVLDEPAPSREELMDSIRSVIVKAVEKVAQEFYHQYPASPEVPSSKVVVELPSSPSRAVTGQKHRSNLVIDTAVEVQAALEKRKEEFLDYLVSQGVFLELRDSLADRIKQLLRFEYDALEADRDMDRGGSTEDFLFTDKSFVVENSSTLNENSDNRNASAPASRRNGQDVGQTASRGGTAGTATPAATVTSTIMTPQEILASTMPGEHYRLLQREMNEIINAMFDGALLSRDNRDLSKNARILGGSSSSRRNNSSSSSGIDSSSNAREEQRVLLASLKDQAADALADGRFATAEKLHQERIAIVTSSNSNYSNSNNSNNSNNSSGNNNVSKDNLHEAYALFGQFYLKQLAAVSKASVKGGGSGGGSGSDAAKAANRRSALLSRAKDALRTAFSADDSKWETGLLYAAVLAELGEEDMEEAERVLNKVLEIQLQAAEQEHVMQNFSEFDGYETDCLCPVHPKTYALLATVFSVQGFPLRTRKALRLAAKCATGMYVDAASGGLGPDRTIVQCLCETTLYLCGLALDKLGRECNALARELQASITEIATAKGRIANTSSHLRHLLFMTEATLLMAKIPPLSAGGNNSNVSNNSNMASPPEAESLLEAAISSVNVALTPSDIVSGWAMVAASQEFVGASKEDVAEAFTSMAEVASTIPLALLQSDAELLPLGCLVKGGRVLLGEGRYEESIPFLLFACSVYKASNCLFLLLGLALLKLGRLAESEEALVEANKLDNRNPECWGYLSLLGLISGPHRADYADKCLFQALRLELNDVALLSLLAHANATADQLAAAETLARRVLALSPLGRNPSMRRLLASVLVAKKQPALAVEEYQRLISSNSISDHEKLEAAEQCSTVLASVGRDEELKQLATIILSLKQSIAAVAEADKR